MSIQLRQSLFMGLLKFSFASHGISLPFLTEA